MRHEFTCTTHALSEYEKKNRESLTFWSAILFWKMACFWANLHYIAHSSKRGNSTLTRPYGLIRDQDWLKINWNCPVWYKESKKCKSFEFCLSVRVVYAHNARADAYARKILKCLKWPETCSKLIKKWFWAFLNFDARVSARNDA